jgi:hypothetical protein
MKILVLVLAVGWGWSAQAEETNRLARGEVPVFDLVLQALSSSQAMHQELFLRGLNGPVLVMEPLRSAPLRELLPNSTVFRLISSSDLLHYADFTALLLNTNGAPSHLKSDREVALFLDGISNPVESRDDALRLIKAFAELRSYKVVTTVPDFRDIRPPEKQPPALETDFKFVAEETDDRWRVHATLFTSEYSDSYHRYVFTIPKPPGAGLHFEEPVLIRLRNYVF